MGLDDAGVGLEASAVRGSLGAWRARHDGQQAKHVGARRVTLGVMQAIQYHGLSPVVRLRSLVMCGCVVEMSVEVLEAGAEAEVLYQTEKICCYCLILHKL